MQALLEQIGTEILKYILMAVPILGLAGIEWLRRHLQAKAAVQATTEVELRAAEVPMASAMKKATAKIKTLALLPRAARPLTAAGFDRLIEKSVPKARERVSHPPASD